MEALDSTGSRIRYLRKRAGLSQEAIAAMIYVSREAFRDWELNESQPGCDSLIALAKCFRVSVDFILGIDGANVRLDRLTEDEAHHQVEHVAMDRGITKRKAAEYLLRLME